MCWSSFTLCSSLSIGLVVLVISHDWLSCPYYHSNLVCPFEVFTDLSCILVAHLTLFSTSLLFPLLSLWPGLPVFISIDHLLCFGAVALPVCKSHCCCALFISFPEYISVSLRLEFVSLSCLFRLLMNCDLALSPVIQICIYVHAYICMFVYIYGWNCTKLESFCCAFIVVLGSSSACTSMCLFCFIFLHHWVALAIQLTCAFPSYGLYTVKPHDHIYACDWVYLWTGLHLHCAVAWTFSLLYWLSYWTCWVLCALLHCCCCRSCVESLTWPLHFVSDLAL